MLLIIYTLEIMWEVIRMHDIRLQAKSGEKTVLYVMKDSSVELYFDNSVKLTTTSTGFSVTGTGLGNFKANDNSYLTAGTGDDLQIYHDGNHSYLDNDKGHLYIRNNVDGDVGGDILKLMLMIMRMELLSMMILV